MREDINDSIENEELNNSISLKEIFDLIKRNAILITLTTLIGILIAFVYVNKVKRTLYSSQATVSIQVNTENGNGNEYNAFVYSSVLVNTMIEFMQSEPVVNKVAELVLNYSKVEKEDTIYYVNAEGSKFSPEEYNRIVIAKGKAIQSGIKIDGNDNNLIVRVKYSSYDESEVLFITNKIIEVAHDVALTKKFSSASFSYDDVVIERVAKKAVIKSYHLTEIKDITGEVVGYTTDDGTSWSTLLFDSKVNNAIYSIKNCLEVYLTDADPQELVVSIRVTNFNDPNINLELISYCATYLSEEAQLGNINVYSKDQYQYPIFANKIEMMNSATTVSMYIGTFRYLTIGACAGIIISLCFIIMRYLLDDTYTSKEELEIISGAPLFASIIDFDKKGEQK